MSIPVKLSAKGHEDIMASARCIEECRSGDTSLETWVVDLEGEIEDGALGHRDVLRRIGRTFECYSDRRRQWTIAGHSFGSVKIDGVTRYVYAINP